MPGPVTTETSEGVHVVLVDDGAVNALSPELMDRLGEAIAAAPVGSALVIAGRPGCLCAGLDRTSMLGGDRAAVSHNLRRVTELYDQVLAHPGPTVVAATGHALAAGALLLLVADLRIGARVRCKIGFNEVQIGLPLAPLAVAAARAKLDPRSLLSATVHGAVYDADVAKRVGFLDELVDVPGDGAAAVRTVVDVAVARGGALAAHDNKAYLRTRDLVWGPVRDEVVAALARRDRARPPI